MNPISTSPGHPIVCGTDFSENAAQAATAAAVLAARAGRPLVLLHVADEFNARSGSPEELELHLAPVREKLAAEVARLGATGAAVTGEILSGRVAEDAILAYTATHTAQLVVLSAVSKTAFDRWTLGSVSETIAEAAPAATLVVRAGAVFEAWMRGERPLRVFVATDFSRTSDAALRWVAALRQLGPCEVTAAYVDWPPEERNRLGVRGGPGLTDNLPAVQEVLERDLREKVVAAFGSEGAQICIRAGWGRVDAHLVDLATAAQADLVVVGTHQRHGLDRLRHGSVSRGILRHANMNVAVVPAVAAPAPAESVHPCRRVVAAVDLAEHGCLSLPYAYSVVNDGGTVRIVYVVKSTRGSGGGAVSPAVAEGTARLRALVPAEAEARGIRTEIDMIEDDDPARGICGAAETANADLVCIGGHARPGAVARVMGSVALGVLQQCRRPVLVVWPPEK